MNHPSHPRETTDPEESEQTNRSETGSGSRVLHLGAGVIYGGVESFLSSMARHSTRTEPEFAVCARGRLEQELAAAGRRVEVLPQVRLSNPWQVWRARRALGRVLDNRSYRIAMSHSGWMQILFGPVLRRHGLPFAVWIHGISNDQSWMERLARRHRPVRVFTASRHLAALTGDWYPGIPRETVAIPVAAPAVVSPDQRAAVRRELGADPSDTVVMISCRFEPWKGHEELFQALALLKRIPGWKLWVAGGAQEEHERRRLELLQTLASQASIGARIRYLGQRTDVPTLLQAADLHCQPNPDPEPFGIAFVEALYAGIPVVSTAIGGALEIIRPECGILVPPRDVPALAAALKDLIENPERRRQLGAAGPRLADLLCNPQRQVRTAELALIGSIPPGR